MAVGGRGIAVRSPTNSRLDSFFFKRGEINKKKGDRRSDRWIELRVERHGWEIEELNCAKRRAT